MKIQLKSTIVTYVDLTSETPKLETLTIDGQIGVRDVSKHLPENAKFIKKENITENYEIEADIIKRHGSIIPNEGAVEPETKS